MTSENQPTNPRSNKVPKLSSEDEVERQVAEQVSQAKTQARKEEVLEIYEDLLQTIWNRIIPTLGRMTVMAIMERALLTTQEQYPVIKHLSVTPEGISFEVLRQRIGNEDRTILREALKELVTDLIDILAMLTGDILVRKLIKEIEGRKLS